MRQTAARRSCRRRQLGHVVADRLVYYTGALLGRCLAAAVPAPDAQPREGGDDDTGAEHGADGNSRLFAVREFVGGLVGKDNV